MTNEKLAEAVIDFVNAIEAACIQLKQNIGEQHGIGVREENFDVLTFEKQTGARIGEFEVASKEKNLPDKWNRAFQILKKSNATIGSRYQGPAYRYSYWVYNSRIYRQARKTK